MFVPHYSQDPHTRSLVTSTEIIQHKPLLTIKYDDYYEEVADFRTFPFKEVFSNAPLIRKRGKNADQIAYYDLVSTFDIETTSIEADPPFSFMYQWQFCLEDYVFMENASVQEYKRIFNEYFSETPALTVSSVDSKN